MCGHLLYIYCCLPHTNTNIVIVCVCVCLNRRLLCVWQGVGSGVSLEKRPMSMPRSPKYRWVWSAQRSGRRSGRRDRRESCDRTAVECGHNTQPRVTASSHIHTDIHILVPDIYTSSLYMPRLYIDIHQELLRLRSQLGLGRNAMRSFVIVPSNYNARLFSGKCVSLYMRYLPYYTRQRGGDYNYIASEATSKLNWTLSSNLFDFWG